MQIEEYGRWSRIRTLDDQLKEEPGHIEYDNCEHNWVGHFKHGILNESFGFSVHEGMGFRIDADSSSNLIFIDASSDKIGIR